MLTEAKNQFKVTFLSIKYAFIRELLNKVTFVTNIVFMMLNNASFLVQWLLLFSLKDNVGNYSFNQVLILWAMASSSYGISHFFFKKAYYLPDDINNGKLDAYLVQPKNVLIASITSDIEVSALGDMLYGLIVFLIVEHNILSILLYIFFSIASSFIITSIAIILGSLSFWIGKSDQIADTINNLMISFATYPDGIFKGVVKVILYTIIPVGIANYIPVSVLTKFNFGLTSVVILFTIFITLLAFIIFYKGLKRYSSSNLMASRI